MADALVIEARAQYRLAPAIVVGLAVSSAIDASS
jgi:hypothetical protein